MRRGVTCLIALAFGSVLLWLFLRGRPYGDDTASTAQPSPPTHETVAARSPNDGDARRGPFRATKAMPPRPIGPRDASLFVAPPSIVKGDGGAPEPGGGSPGDWSDHAIREALASVAHDSEELDRLLSLEQPGAAELLLNDAELAEVGNETAEMMAFIGENDPLNPSRDQIRTTNLIFAARRKILGGERFQQFVQEWTRLLIERERAAEVLRGDGGIQ